MEFHCRDDSSCLPCLRFQALVAHQLHGIFFLLWLTSTHIADNFMDRDINPGCSVLLRRLFCILHAHDGHCGNETRRTDQTSISAARWLHYACRGSRRISINGSISRVSSKEEDNGHAWVR